MEKPVTLTGIVEGILEQLPHDLAQELRRNYEPVRNPGRPLHSRYRRIAGQPMFLELEARTSDEDLGLKLATNFNLDRPGRYLRMFDACADLRMVILALIRYQAGLSSGYRTELTLDGAFATVGGVHETAVKSPLETEFGGALIIRIARRLVPGFQLHTLSLPLRHERPALEEYFGCPVALGPSSARFSAEFLDVPCRGADSAWYRKYEEWAEMDLTPVREASLLGKIENIYDSAVHLGNDEILSICDRFAVSERTLRRLLGRVNTSHRKQRARARAKRAMRLLASRDLSIADVAEIAGYRNGASFARAFARWMGETPGTFRRRYGRFLREHLVS